MLRILHIFAPSLKTRFSGDTIMWKSKFENWSDPHVTHYVLDCEQKRIVDTQSAFSYDLPEKQRISSRWERITWSFALLRLLSRHGKDFDILHFHVLWWGSLLAARWAKRHKISCVYESVLLDADNPGSVKNERFGKLKVNLLRKFKGILAISDYLAQDYLLHAFATNQVFTLMNSVDLEVFHPCENLSEKQALREKYSLPAKATILLFVGSVIERKGVDLLVKAFVDASVINPNLYLLIIGPHNKKENPSLDEAFIAGLKEQLDERNTHAKVNFVRTCQRQE